MRCVNLDTSKGTCITLCQSCSHTSPRVLRCFGNLTYPKSISALQVKLPLGVSLVVDEKARIEDEETSLEGFVEPALLLHVARHERLVQLEGEPLSLRDWRRHNDYLFLQV